MDHDKERAQAAGLEPNGFSFEGADPSGVDYALNRSVNKPSDEWVGFSLLFHQKFLSFINFLHTRILVFQGKVTKVTTLLAHNLLRYAFFRLFICLDEHGINVESCLYFSPSISSQFPDCLHVTTISLQESLFSFQSNFCMVQRSKLVSFIVQESYGARLVLEPTCS